MAETRRLTVREVWAARSVLGNAVDYGRVIVHRDTYIFFQPSDTAMTPNGEIYFPPPVYKPDFGATVGDAAWIVHELTHVWQFQNGVNLILRAPFARNYTYGPITARTRFADLNIEQQAAMVADCFLIVNASAPQHGSGTLAQYRALLPFHPVP